MKAKDMWIIIPAYNEEKNIGDVIDKGKRYSDTIVIVDDGSKDKTYDVAKSKGVIVLRHILNLGKGAALKTGCEYAVDNEAKILVVLDADGQHDPDKIPGFLEALKDDDIVFGYRAFDENMPLVLKFGNWFISKMTRILFGLNLRDTQSGFRAFTADAYKKIRWKAQDYDMESEMIAKVGKYNLKYKEIPIQTIYLDKAKGTTVLDGIKIVMKMFWWKITG